MSDIRLYHTEKGTGVPFILLHGNGESSEYFGDQIGYFSKMYRVMAVDTRGHGSSPRGTAPFTLSQFADDLHDLMTENGISRAHILGFSDGGNIALIFAMRYPEMVMDLILNGANLRPSGMTFGVRSEVYMEYALYSFLALFGGKAGRRKEMLSLMALQPHISDADLASVCARTLIIVGERDMIRASHSREMAESIPGAELKILEGDHFIASERSREFNEAVSEFMGRGPHG